MKSLKNQNPLKFILFISPFLKYKIIGNSMFPTLKNDEIVLVNKLSYLFQKPKKNDIISFRDPRDGKTLIKRITTISNNKYFVTGDNKLASTDSRKFGMIERKSIIGKIIQF